ncbi:MAG TPA: hypothetical protein VLH41_01345, partial [Thermoanaerobaculia bacterium]|nr:hypothetical protein [Thermoanaerobaculia bacterium]
MASVPLRVDEHTAPGVLSNLNGVFEAGETVRVETSWMNPGSMPFSLTGLAQNFTGPAGPAYAIVTGKADYGALAPLATGNCHDATGSCFALQIAGARPVQHWDATFSRPSAWRRLPAAGFRRPRTPGRSTSVRAFPTCPRATCSTP